MATPRHPRRAASATRTLAIDVGTNYVRAVEADFQAGRVRVLRHGKAQAPADALVNARNGASRLADSIKEALARGGIVAGAAVVSIPRRFVTIKYARLPKAKPEELAGMIGYEAQQYIPFPLDEVVMDYCAFSESPNGNGIKQGPESDNVTIMIVAVRRELVNDLLAAFDLAGVEVTRLTVSALALAELGSEMTEPTALLNIDEKQIDLAVVENGNSTFTRNNVLDELITTQSGTEAVVREVVRSLASYQNENAGRKIERLLVGGMGPLFDPLEPLLAQALEIPVEKLAVSWLDPVKGTSTTTYGLVDEDLADLLTAVALASQQLRQTDGLINLVPAERKERKKVARRKARQRLVGVAAVLLLLAGAGYGYIWWKGLQHEEIVAMAANRRLTTVSNQLDSVKKNNKSLVTMMDRVTTGLARTAPLIDLIKALSDSIPQDGSIYLTQIAFDRKGGVLTVRGDADTTVAATNLLLALQHSAPMQSVQLNYLGDNPNLSQAAAKKSGGKISYIITCLPSNDWVAVEKLPIPKAIQVVKKRIVKKSSKGSIPGNHLSASRNHSGGGSKGFYGYGFGGGGF